MTIYAHPNGNGAQVFATGSMQWNWGVDSFGSHVPDFPSRVHAGAQQLTHNLLRTFADKNRAPVVFVNTDAITAGDWRQPECNPQVRVYGVDGYRIADGAGSFDSTPGYVQQFSISGESNQAWPDKASDPRALLKACPATDRVAAAWTTTESQNSSFTIDLTFTDTAKHQVTLYCADWLGTGTSLQQIDVYDFTDTSHPLDTRIFLLPPNGIYLVWHLNSPGESVGEPSRRKIIRVSKPDAQAGTKAMVSAVFFDPIQYQ